MIFYYSGCGNSRYIAKRIAEALDERLIFIPEAARNEHYQYTLAEGERIGFVFPVYSWRPPLLVEDFISRLTIDGTPSFVFMAATAGGNAGLTEDVFRDALAAIGIKLDAAYCFIMPNTYVNMMGMTIDSERVAQRKIAQTKRELPTVIENIREGKRCSNVKKGIFPRIKTYSIGKSFYKWMTDKPFFATDACVSCGRCAAVCPLQNITMVEGKPKWNGNCTNCEACYHHCPKNAVQFGTKTKGKGQYIFPE